MRWPGVCLALLLAAPARAEVGPAAVATVSKTRVSVGEPFTVEVRASGPAGSVFAFPAGAATDSFELRPAPSAADTAGVHHYQAAVFALGQARVPGIPIRYRLASGPELDPGAVRRWCCHGQPSSPASVIRPRGRGARAGRTAV